MAFRPAAAIAALCLGLAACASAPKADEPVKVLAPQGAPALATLGLPENAKVDYVEGQEVLISELAKKDGEYDLILAPINLGVKSWSESQTYMLDGVVTWGNLYIASEKEDWNQAGSVTAAFGEGAVPGMVFNTLYPELNCEVVYYPSVAEASQALLSGKADAALLAQPAAAAAIGKGKEKGMDLSLVADLQDEWQQKENTSQKGYPQAALFVKASSVDKTRAAVKDMEDFLKEPTEDQIREAVEVKGADVLGVPSTDIAVNTWKMQNVHYEPASKVLDDINTFLGVFKMSVPEDMVVSSK